MQKPDAQQAPRVGDRLGMPARRLVGVEHGGGVGAEGDTVRVQLEALAVSREQRHADGCLEPRQRARHVRLVDSQLGRGVAGVLGLREREERTQGLLVHAHRLTAKCGQRIKKASCVI